MKIIYKQTSDLAEILGAIRLRIEVFVVEQGYRVTLEPDEYDKTAKHFVALASDEIIATARVIETKKDEFRIARMATKKPYRGKSIGSDLLAFIVKRLLKYKPKRIWLRAQVTAESFYAKRGFRTVSPVFEHEGTPHVDMDYPI